MAVFDEKSRYALFAITYEAIDQGGRRVLALAPALMRSPQTKLGEHLRKDSQRLDHLAAFYLGDANGFWRLAEANSAVLPDALAEARVIIIPTRR